MIESFEFFSSATNPDCRKQYPSGPFLLADHPGMMGGAKAQRERQGAENHTRLPCPEG